MRSLASKMAMQFAQEELDAFGFTDLRSTDFVEAGGRYFRPAASRAQILENAGLADALTRQTELTQREWDAFGVRGLRMSHLLKAGDAYYRPAGTEEQKDVRVLRSLAHYGTFGKDGRLTWDVGDKVAITMCNPSTFTGSNFRQNGIGRGDAPPSIKGDKSLTVEQCAEVCVAAADRRVRSVVMPGKVYFVSALHPMMPTWVEPIIKRGAKL